MIYPPSQKPPIWSIDPGVIAYNCQKAGMPHPVLAMPMWEGAGSLARDYSGHGNHGELVGAPEWRKDGLDFGGVNDYINTGDMDISGDGLTISALITPNFTQATGDYDVISDKAGSANTHAWRFLFNRDVEDFRFRLFTSAGAVNCDTVGLTWNIGESYNIVATYNGSTMKIFWDGVEQNSVNHSGNITTNDIDHLIGFSSGDLEWTHFDGGIKNTCMFDVGLTASQVKFISDNPYFMYQIPEELYGYVAAAPPVGNPAWYYNMLKRRN
jgi:hypothetical protein